MTICLVIKSWILTDVLFIIIAGPVVTPVPRRPQGPFLNALLYSDWQTEQQGFCLPKNTPLIKWAVTAVRKSLVAQVIGGFSTQWSWQVLSHTMCHFQSSKAEIILYLHRLSSLFVLEPKWTTCSTYSAEVADSSLLIIFPAQAQTV